MLANRAFRSLGWITRSPATMNHSAVVVCFLLVLAIESIFPAYPNFSLDISVLRASSLDFPISLYSFCIFKPQWPIYHCISLYSVGTLLVVSVCETCELIQNRRFTELGSSSPELKMKACDQHPERREIQTSPRTLSNSFLHRPVIGES